jgi:hypothetical protein
MFQRLDQMHDEFRQLARRRLAVGRSDSLETHRQLKR